MQADPTGGRTPYQHHHSVHTEARPHLVVPLDRDPGQKLGVVCPVLEGIPIFGNPITKAPSGLSSPRKLKGEGADVNPLLGAEPASRAAPVPPADTRAAAQVHAEDPIPKLLQVGMSAADRFVFQAKTAVFVPADQDKRVLKDAPFAVRAAWTQDVQLQGSDGSAARPEQVGQMLAHGRRTSGKRRFRDAS